MKELASVTPQEGNTGDHPNAGTWRAPPSAAAEALAHSLASGPAERRPYLIAIGGPLLGHSFELDTGHDVVIGRGPDVHVQLTERGVSREHARIARADSGFVLTDLGSTNGTFLNDAPLSAPAPIREGDKIRVGRAVFKVVYHDDLEESYQRFVLEAATQVSRPKPPRMRIAWSPDSWRTCPIQQSVEYPDEAAVLAACEKLQRLPPLVTSDEVDSLKELIADAQEGRRFWLQGGDCAETVQDCEPQILTNKLKILTQMALVLTYGSRRPVIRVGRFAGQYAKPRSRATEVRGDVELPSYFGDLVNRPSFTPQARTANPGFLVDCYLHAASALNFIRALGSSVTDLRRPEYFDLSYFERGAKLSSRLRDEYQRICKDITQGLQFMTALDDRSADRLVRPNVFTSHEGLSLLYESALTRRVPRREGFYDLSTHFPWIGERTRSLSGAHVEFFRGIENPVGVKVGPSMDPRELIELCEVLNPDNEPGKLVLITRMGVTNVATRLPPLVEAVLSAKTRVLWVSDPMHGNAIVAPHGVKTRDFDDILHEVELTANVHADLDSYFGGVHFEFTGEDVTECVGGGLTMADLEKAYTTACDPRLNYRQSLEMAFAITGKLSPSRPQDTNRPTP